jgi:hypothetical protein
MNPHQKNKIDISVSLDNTTPAFILTGTHRNSLLMNNDSSAFMASSQIRKISSRTNSRYEFPSPNIPQAFIFLTCSSPSFSHASLL